MMALLFWECFPKASSWLGFCYNLLPKFRWVSLQHHSKSLYKVKALRIVLHSPIENFSKTCCWKICFRYQNLGKKVVSYLWILISVFDWVENMGKGENGGYQHFLLFPQCFQKASKLVIMGKDFTTQSRLLTTLRKKLFENIVGKGENAHNQHFLLFSQCFLPYMTLIFHLDQSKILCLVVS